MTHSAPLHNPQPQGRPTSLWPVGLLLLALWVWGMLAGGQGIHTDISGSPLAVTNAAGNVVWKDNYSAYGERQLGTTTVANQSQWFHGKEVDASTGLQYFGARYYDPAVGRFMGIDPVGFQEDNLHSFNRYAYGNNNPVRYLDPDGNTPIHAILAITAILFEINAVANGDPPTPLGPVGSTGKVAGKALLGDGAELAAKRVQENRLAGEAFEQLKKRELSSTQEGIVEQVTIKTKGGVKTKIDLIGRDASTGAIKCSECKSSATAPLTKNQKTAFPEIESSGGVVVGKGKPGFPGGTIIPPTKIDVIRP